MTETEGAETGQGAATSGAPPARVSAPHRSGFWGGLAGGVVAAAVGFAMAQFVPGGWPLADTPAMQADLATLKSEIAVMATKVAELPTSSVPPGMSALSDRVAAMESAMSAPIPSVDLAPLESRVTALENRLAAIEALPAGETGASSVVIAAQGTAIRQLQAQLQQVLSGQTVSALSPEAEAEVKAAIAAAAAAAIKTDGASVLQVIKATAALGRIQAAMDSGAPFTSALVDLGDVPATLKDSASTGVSTLGALQSSFPDAARAALEAALQANMGESWSDRVANFLRAQTGARSLAPRDGPDPDAVLSRAEARLDAGDVDGALAEISALPEPAQTALADWRGKAEARQAAVAAVAALAQSLGQ